MRRVFKKLSIAIAIAALLGLTGCSSSEPPTGEKLKSAVAELEARGFTDPRWESYTETFTVGVGRCRMPIREGAQDWTLTLTTLGVPGKLPEVRGANLATLEKLQSIKACFEEGGSK